MIIDIVVSPTGKPGEWVLLEDLDYRGIHIPTGFIFDGASIPWLLQPIVRKGGKIFAPACIHDFLYRHAKGDRKACDIVFHTALLENGVNPSKAQTIYLGVRTGGWVAWRKNLNIMKRTA